MSNVCGELANIRYFGRGCIYSQHGLLLYDSLIHHVHELCLILEYSIEFARICCILLETLSQSTACVDAHIHVLNSPKVTFNYVHIYTQVITCFLRTEEP
jgi:hypothetical protein